VNRCARCGAENRPGRRFCAECGEPLTQACPACGFANEPGEKFCGGCGQLLGATPAAAEFAAPASYTPKHLAEKILTFRSALEGERKQVTVLFCDLANSTGLAERLGPEGMHALLNRFFELALGEVHRYEGTINQFLGDGFMALFGAPLAHEDHARRAVLAALAIQQALQEHRPALSEGLAVRMGLNTGLVVVGGIGNDLRMDYTAVGDTTNVAARLQQLAEPGTVLVGKATARLVEGYVGLERIGPVQLKGKDESITAYKLLGLGPRRTRLEGLGARPLSPFVGRERELRTLHEILAQVEADRGQVVGMVGEAGVGKSRLLYEFRRSLESEAVTYLEGRCVSYGSATPYLPVLDLVRRAWQIAETDPLAVVVEKVEAALRAVGMPAEETAPYLLVLLGIKERADRLATLTPEAIRVRTFEILRELCGRASRDRPLVLAVEDLHWIDMTSQEFIASLVDGLSGARILLLLTYRPGYRPPWMEKSYATQVALRALSSRESAIVLEAVPGASGIPEALAQAVLQKAEGNPFFLEELARAMAERGEPGVAVPETVQEVLVARIDRLPDGPKRVLQTAAILGREFPLRLLRAILERPGDLEHHLAELTRLEFLFERSRADERVYVFKHALTQEAAYAGLLLPRRQTLHAAAGHALETLYAGRLEEVYDRLAYHFARTDEVAQAVEYLVAFARRAARGFALAEAATALEEALGLAERLPAEERERCLLDIVPRLARALAFLGRVEEALDLLLRHRERIEAVGNPLVAGHYYLMLANTYTFLADQERTVESARRAMEEAQRCGDQPTLAKGHYLLAFGSFWAGQFREGIEHGRAAVALLEGTDERVWLGQTYWILGLNYSSQGDLGAALDALGRARAIGEAIGDPRVYCSAQRVIGVVHVLTGHWQAGIEACQSALRSSKDPFNTAESMGYLGIAYLEQGDPAKALPLLEQAVQQFARFQGRADQGWYTAYLAEAWLLSGQIDKARECAREGLELARRAKYWVVVGSAQRVLGRLAQVTGAYAEAGNHLDEALALFTSIHARYYEARTRLDLAELAHARGNRDGAARHLAEAYPLFRALPAPRYVERTEQLAREFGVALAETTDQR